MRCPPAAQLHAAPAVRALLGAAGHRDHGGGLRHVRLRREWSLPPACSPMLTCHNTMAGPTTTHVAVLTRPAGGSDKKLPQLPLHRLHASPIRAHQVVLVCMEVRRPASGGPTPGGGKPGFFGDPAAQARPGPAAAACKGACVVALWAAGRAPLKPCPPVLRRP